jgi:hypothetical protein
MVPEVSPTLCGWEPSRAARRQPPPARLVGGLRRSGQ